MKGPLGLIGQLKYEGFSTGDATYGASHSGANLRLAPLRRSPRAFASARPAVACGPV